MISHRADPSLRPANKRRRYFVTMSPELHPSFVRKYILSPILDCVVPIISYLLKNRHRLETS